MTDERQNIPRGKKPQTTTGTVRSRHRNIRQLCKRLAQEFKPEKIILFGSHAYGAPRPEFDLDLLVIMRFEGDPLEQAVTMLKRLNVLLPIDLLVRTPEQIQYRLEIGDRFMSNIINRGQVMYEASHA